MCSEVQVQRGWWLKTEIIAFWVFFFLYMGPVIPLRFLSKKSHDDILNADSDEEDDDTEDGDDN